MAAKLTCPHCRKQFTAKQLGSGEQRGFKCPHCRLLVADDRASEPAKTGA